MAVKASATITLTSVIDIQAVYRYYLLQSSTLAKPAKPTTNPPASSWDDAEPTYIAGSTNTLYFVDLTVFSNGTYKYSEVSKSTSYEAAKEAYNKAQNAQSTANNAQSDIDNLEVGGTNLLLNSSFSENFDKWSTTATAFTIAETDGYSCGYVTGELTKTKTCNQSILEKISSDDIEQEYTASIWCKLDNYVVGSTNPCAMIYIGGEYDNNGTTTWLTVGNVSFEPHNNLGWTKVTCTFKVNCERSLITSFTVYVYVRDCTCDLYFRDFKLEKGNRATDWTPAPEDVSEDINDAQNTADNALSRANDAWIDIDAIKATISSLVTGQNGESLMTQTDTGWTFSIKEVLNTLDKAATDINSLNSDMTSAENLIANLNKDVADLGIYTDYIKFGVDGGKPCIILGETDSVFKVVITNTDIRFMEGSSIPASISNQSLNIDKAVIQSELKQGGFLWTTRSNGNLGLLWKG